MKRLMACILAMVMLLGLSACESPQEKASREIREANEAYREAQQDVWDTERELEDLQRKIQQAGG